MQSSFPRTTSGTRHGLFFKTYQPRAMRAEGRLEVGRFVEVVFEAVAQGMAIGSDEVILHFRFGNCPVAEKAKTNERDHVGG